MRPKREKFRQSEQTYFVSFQTVGRLPFFRHERWAMFLLNTLERYRDEFALHDFVIMPGHLHLLMSRVRDLTDFEQLRLYVSKNVQSLRAAAEYRFCGAHADLEMDAVPPWLKPRAEQIVTAGLKPRPFIPSGKT